MLLNIPGEIYYENRIAACEGGGRERELDGVGLTKGDRRFNWNRSNVEQLSLSLARSRGYLTRVSGVAVSVQTRFRSRPQCVSRVSALSLTLIRPETRQSRREREREGERLSRTQATAPLTLTAGIRESSSLASPSVSLRLKKRLQRRLFCSFCSLSRTRNPSSRLPCHRDSVNRNSV